MALDVRWLFGRVCIGQRVDGGGKPVSLDVLVVLLFLRATHALIFVRH